MEILKEYGGFKVVEGYGHYMELRYEIWEDGVLRFYTHNKELCLAHFEKIKDLPKKEYKISGDIEKLPF